MARQGNTTSVGLGWSHQRDARRAKAALIDGTPCGYCGRPMYRWQSLHYDHVIPRALGGRDGPKRLVHAACNIKAGVVLGNKLRRGRRRTRPVAYTRW